MTRVSGSESIQLQAKYPYLEALPGSHRIEVAALFHYVYGGSDPFKSFRYRDTDYTVCSFDLVTSANKTYFFEASVDYRGLTDDCGDIVLRDQRLPMEGPCSFGGRRHIRVYESDAECRLDKVTRLSGDKVVAECAK